MPKAGLEADALAACTESNSLIGVAWCSVGHDVPVRDSVISGTWRSLLRLNTRTAMGSVSFHWCRKSEDKTGGSTVDFDLWCFDDFTGLNGGDFNRTSLDSFGGIVLDFLRIRKKSPIPLDPDRGRGAGKLGPSSGSVGLRCEDGVGSRDKRWQQNKKLARHRNYLSDLFLSWEHPLRTSPCEGVGVTTMGGIWGHGWGSQS